MAVMMSTSQRLVRAISRATGVASVAWIPAFSRGLHRRSPNFSWKRFWNSLARAPVRRLLAAHRVLGVHRG